MGRRRKNESKEEPLVSIDVTKKQFDLLSWVYNEGYGIGASRTRWSPTAYQGRKLTSAEAATLSNRVKTLVERHLLNRDGNEVTLTDLGREAIDHFIRTHPEAVNNVTKEMLALDGDVRLLGSLYKVRDGFIRYRRASGLTKEEAELTLKHFDALHKTVISQVQQRLEIITEEALQK